MVSKHNVSVSGAWLGARGSLEGAHHMDCVQLPELQNTDQGHADGTRH